MNNAPHEDRPFLPFAAGFSWLTGAVSLIRSNAPRLLLLGLLLQLLGGASQVGFLGIMFLLAAPALTAGMLQGMHLAAEGQKPSAFVLFSAFQGSGKLLSLFLLGFLGLALSFVLVTVLLAGAVTGMDPELLARIQSGDQAAVAELDPALVQKILLGVLAGLGLGLVLSFFAVPLIWFRGLGLGGALWTGILTMFREWRALTALGIGLFALGVPVAMLAGGIVAAQLSSSSPSMLLTVMLLTLVVLYQVLGFAAQYLAFRAIFWEEESSEDVSPPDNSEGPKGPDDSDDQFVA